MSIEADHIAKVTDTHPVMEKECDCCGHIIKFRTNYLSDYKKCDNCGEKIAVQNRKTGIIFATFP